MEQANDIILSWLPPKQCGAAPVTKYIIEKLLYIDDHEDDYAEWESLGETSEFEWKTTVEAKEKIHFFRIFSENGYGMSKETVRLRYEHVVPGASGRITHIRSLFHEKN